MKTSAFAFVILLLSAFAGAQEPAEYVMNVRLLATNPANPASTEVLARPQMRTRVGHEASLTLGDPQSGFRMKMTPSDLGEGRVGLSVVVETWHDGLTATSTFSLLSGSGASPTTVVLRDAKGAFVLDGKGRPMFAEIEASKR